MGEPLPYTDQRARRLLERAWTWLEEAIDRLASALWNPLYHLGTLQITLLVIIGVTGIYLTVFYRPGADRAFDTVAGMSATWIGSWMRSAHRYASAALIVVALLHALKSFLRDQARGSRWLPWVTGWLLFILFWVIGVLGYWLVWDRSAQWLSEWAIEFGPGASVITFFEPTLTSRTFMFFVIVLFLHVFLSVLIIFWLLIHVIRISNVTIWAPRWVLIATSLLVSLFAVIRPATTGVEADFSQFVGQIELDHWYLGFLPTITNIGNGWLWGASVAVFGLMLAVPWMVRGRRDRKAVVEEALCNGNGRCADVCPYGAIEMVMRDDDSGHERLAVVDPRLCTSCGLCVGVCPTSAIQIPDLPTAVARDRFKETVAAVAHNGQEPVAVFACARHTALGGIPVPVDSPIDVVDWDSGGGNGVHALAVCTVACSGMINSRWIRDVVDAGAEGVIALSCSKDDCRFEQGPNRLAERMSRGWISREPSVQQVEVTPTDDNGLARALTAIQARASNGGGRRSGLLWRGIGIAALAVLLIAPSVAIRNTERAYPADAGLRIGFVHGGEFLPVDVDEIGGEFNPAITPEQIAGSARHPVVLSVAVDGEPYAEESFAPAGLRNEGRSSNVDTLWLGTGTHAVQIRMMDDGATWRVVFEASVVLDAERILTLLWSEQTGQFEELPLRPRTDVD